MRLNHNEMTKGRTKTEPKAKRAEGSGTNFEVKGQIIFLILIYDVFFSPSSSQISFISFFSFWPFPVPVVTQSFF